MSNPRIWSRDDLLSISEVLFAGSFSQRQTVQKLADLMEATEAALAAGGALDAASVIWPAQKSSGAPKVWSRDDFAEACKLTEHSFADTVAKRANAILEHAERNMRGRLPQPRDAKGHFQSPNKLPTLDSPLVISARTGE